LHPYPVALGASPLTLLVVDVSLQFLHLNSAGFAGHRFQNRSFSKLQFRRVCLEDLEKALLAADER
jgi:hypothetical protein